MTKREFMNAVIALAENSTDDHVTVLSSPKTVTKTTESVKIVTTRIYMPELISHAKAEIDLLDKKNAIRSSKPTKAQLENEGIKTQILEVLTSEPMVSSVIGEKVGISTQKASSLCRQLVESGKAQSVEVKLPKKGKQQGYFINVPTDEVTEEVTE